MCKILYGIAFVIMYCPICERVMTWNTDSGKMVYTCPVCLETVNGTEWDVRVAGSTASTTETQEMYKKYLSLASFDRTAQLVMRDCSNCGLDYMTQVRIGTNELVVFTCKCGAQETGASDKKVTRKSDSTTAD